jgi:cytoskeleton protein RodZ
VTPPQSNAIAGGAFPAGATAGALLVAAREASGLSIDAVAQQLKLAPRQVRALEEGDYGHLPGRTFVRGFIKSYARLLRLDPDEVLGALTTGTAASALDAPLLHATTQTMGELPTAEHSKAAWTRWAIPLTLAAVVAAAAVYEWGRPMGAAYTAVPTATAPATSAPAPAVSDKTGTPLPNPVLAGTSIAEPSRANEPAAAIALPATATAAAPAAEEAIAITYRDNSWTEIRDRDGRVVLSGMNRGGTTQNVSGTPPLDVVIGNASDVSVIYRGNPVDLVPHTRQNVARLRLP